jgi:hypothetical protein
MIRRLSILLACVTSPVLADIPTVDRPVLDERQNRDRRTSEIEEVVKDRYVGNRSVTCSVYRPGRRDDPVGAANANPAIAGMVRRVAREEGIDENQFLALVYQESRFNPCARSPAGAIGLTQLMPGTAADLGVDPYNIEQNMRGGARYYRQQLQRYNGNISLTLAAYNAGHGNVHKYGGIPPFRETQGYVANITSKWLPAFGGSDKSDIPLNYGGGDAYGSARTITLNAMGLTAATAESSGDVASWLHQLGQLPTATIQDSWEHNAGARNANLELLNRLIQLGSAFADLANSRNAVMLGDLSGASRSTRYGAADDRPASGLCDEGRGLVWNVAAEGCAVRIDGQTELLLEVQ